MSQASLSSKVQPAAWVSCRQLAGEVIIENTRRLVRGSSRRTGAERAELTADGGGAVLVSAHAVGDRGGGVWFGGFG